MIDIQAVYKAVKQLELSHSFGVPILALDRELNKQGSVMFLQGKD